MILKSPVKLVDRPRSALWREGKEKEREISSLDLIGMRPCAPNCPFMDVNS